MIVYLHPLTQPDIGCSGGQARQNDLVAQLVEHLPFKERVLGSSKVAGILHLQLGTVGSDDRLVHRSLGGGGSGSQPQPGHKVKWKS